MTWVPIPKATSVDLSWIGRLMDGIGSADMNQALLEAVNELVPVEEICGFLISSQPHTIGHCGRRADSAKRALLYADRYYRSDPLRSDLAGERVPGKMLVRTDRAYGIADHQYRWEFFDDPHFGSRVTIARANPQGWSLIHFYLAESAPSETTVAELFRFTVAAFPAVRRHFNLPDWDRQNEMDPPANRIEARLAARFPTLTSREREVCAMTIVGVHARQIAQQIGISTATALTYRRRAYERLGINSAAELVPYLI